MFVNVFISCIRSHRQSVGICVQKSKVQALSLLMFGNVFISCILYPLIGRAWESVYKSPRSKRYGVCNIVYAVYKYRCTCIMDSGCSVMKMLANLDGSRKLLQRVKRKNLQIEKPSLTTIWKQFYG